MPTTLPPKPLDTRPLLRLHQLACDIRLALDRQDWELVDHASKLLPSSLEACAKIPTEAFQNDPELASMAKDIFDSLTRCDAEIEEKMDHVIHDLRRLRMGQRQTHWMKPTAVVNERRRLDTLR